MHFHERHLVFKVYSIYSCNQFSARTGIDCLTVLEYGYI